MHRTLVDVTQLIHLSGKLTGIPRVMNELGMRFYRLRDPNVIFVGWVKELGSYCELDFGATMVRRGHSIVYLKTGQATPLASDQASDQTGGDGVLPPPHPLKRLAKAGLAGTRRVSGRLAAVLEVQAQKLHMRDYKKVELGADDTIFIPWGEWWDDNFIAMLQTAHKDGGKIVQVIHDLGPIVTPQFSSHSTDSLTTYCHKIIPICHLVVVVSQNAKQELEHWLSAHNYRLPPIKVFRNGDDFAFAKAERPDDPLFTQSGLNSQDFILSVGTVEIRKNHLLYYYAYKLAKARGIKLPKLLIVGRLSWPGGALYELITKDEDVNKDILFLQNVSDNQLSWLYDNCLFTLYVSFYEGWGVPIAESLARGVPCVCGNVGSMLEIAPGITYDVPPASTDECLQQIQWLLEPANLKTARDRTKTYKPTSWDTSFAQINNYIKELDHAAS